MAQIVERPPVALAPLPVPEASQTLKRIRRPRRAEPPGASPALIPLFYAALLFLAGIVLSRYQYLRPGYLLADLLPLAILAVCAIWKAPRLIWLPIGAIWLVLGVWSAETEPAPAPNPAIAQLSDGLLRTVEGTVTDAGPLRRRDATGDSLEDQEPETLPETQGGQIQRVDLQLSSAEVITDASDAILPMPKTGATKLRLSVVWPSLPGEAIRCGQRLRAVVRILPPDTFHDPGVWSRATYLETQEITASASVFATRRDGNEPRLSLLSPSNENSATCLLNQARNAASARLQTLPTLTSNLPRFLRATPEDSAMLTALLTGDRTYLTHSLRAGFERTGCFHLVVVSGLHLAILAGGIFALARRLRLSLLPATALTIALSLGYAVFTGFGIPVQRSFWMITA